MNLQLMTAVLDATYKALEAPAKHLCPACDEPMNVQTKTFGVCSWIAVECLNDDCKSEAAYDGGTGQTVQEAVTELEEAVEGEDYR